VADDHLDDTVDAAHVHVPVVATAAAARPHPHDRSLHWFSRPEALSASTEEMAGGEGIVWSFSRVCQWRLAS
jgi:hypothetical protein